MPGNWGVVELHEGLDSGDGRRDGVLRVGLLGVVGVERRRRVG